MALIPETKSISLEEAKQQRQHLYDLQPFATEPIDSPLTHKHCLNQPRLCSSHVWQCNLN